MELAWPYVHFLLNAQCSCKFLSTKSAVEPLLLSLNWADFKYLWGSIRNSAKGNICCLYG